MFPKQISGRKSWGNHDRKCRYRIFYNRYNWPMAFSRNLVSAKRYKKGIKEMRWSKRRRKRQLTVGDQRVKKKFLIIPKCLPEGEYGGGKQWRWLERSRIVQKLTYKRWFPIFGENNVWENVSWE